MSLEVPLIKDFLYSMKETSVLESSIPDEETFLKPGELHLDLTVKEQVSPSARFSTVTCWVEFTLSSKVTSAVSPHLSFLNGQKDRA